MFNIRKKKQPRKTCRIQKIKIYVIRIKFSCEFNHKILNNILSCNPFQHQFRLREKKNVVIIGKTQQRIKNI